MFKIQVIEFVFLTFWDADMMGMGVDGCLIPSVAVGFGGCD